MSKPEFSLSVVVPVLNEADSIEPFIQALTPVLTALTPHWELIFIDDGSTDQTLLCLQKLAAVDTHIVYISLSRNFGKDLALTAGIDHAQGDAVIPMDVDLQDPPQVISEMVRMWRDEQVDVVYATRNRRDSDTHTKRLTAAWFYQLMSWISPLRIPRNSGDFRLLDKRVVNELRKLRERNRFMRGLFTWVGFRQASVSFARAPRHVGKSKYGFRKMWNFALEGVTSFSNAPLRLSMYLGFAVSIFAFAFAAVILVKTLVYGRDWPGYASIMITMLFLGGVQLIAMGFIGEYIGRIYNEVKQRPLYVVAETSLKNADDKEAVR